VSFKEIQFFTKTGQDKIGISIILMLIHNIFVVEFLTVRTEGNTSLSVSRSKFFFSRDLKSNEAAALPMLNAGCVMVVSEGSKIMAVFKFEKLITATSSGIFNCNCLQAIYMLAVNLSTLAIIPLGLSSLFNKFFIIYLYNINFFRFDNSKKKRY